MKKIIISGGGTGGHVYPAIAIADALKQIEPDIQILFVGAEGKMEMEKVPQAGYRIIGLPISGFQRQQMWKNVSFPFRLIKSLYQSWQIINDFCPNVVVGVGGYASGAILQVAVWRKIPTLIQEQNGYAGFTNKILAPQVQKICVAYPDMGKYFPKEKIVFTGNPVRQKIAQNQISHQQACAFWGFSPQKKTLLVLGGSLGAKTINQSILKGLFAFEQHSVQLLWQTGKNYYDNILQNIAPEHRNSTHIKILPFITEMDFAYKAADVVISRAGALSISELCLAGKPCILVPSPNVAEDHQTKNAMALVQKEAAIMVKDSEADSTLVNTALQLLSDSATQQKLSSHISAFAKPEAARNIAQEILKLC
ncbi:MAG: undecaprenyldiphospho-muramoylpentapeptide beta-N-acetylglucosaminyltransferase [Cytophagales bacterium]|nr:undecaprenyldiphospho-muramoylpentapeptide beta-N-acetylglucosaminyltransferase [Cytophagales bacterium]MDW8384489.1 undecaprenyldiphospho-muramoylpentapeptide beta-N-acetylglucosaminyltransferase [Flammeovirgaceae bacterium]